MNDLDELVRTSLAGAADDDVHVEKLLASARAGGLRRRRRRALGQAAAVVLTVVAVAVGTATVLRPPPEEPNPATGSTLPTGRIVPGAPSPLDDPGVLGAAPLVHLTLTASPFTAATVRYLTDSDRLVATGTVATPPASESMTLESADGDVLYVGVGSEPPDDRLPTRQTGKSTQVRIGGREGTLFQYDQAPPDIKGSRTKGIRSVLTWPVSDTLTARINTSLDDRAKILAAANGLRFDRVHSCGPAFRLPWSPPNLQPIRCELEFKGNQVSRTYLRLSSGTVDEALDVSMDNAAIPSTQPSGLPELATANINGRATWLTADDRQARFTFGGAWFFLYGASADITRQVAGTIEPIGFDPQQWPL
ncbi:hypothetical protein ACQP00_15375 [Dactylosporangium sp. CS-047395]|uniref:hypothetical protein n=1 Tax=Dactylosporangium sp. CS-047395 TaxID=3239936 RepID=UPI003D903758